jgi:hypothetical protein
VVVALGAGCGAGSGECPATVPVALSKCAGQYLCEYAGPTGKPGCRVNASCQNGAWTVQYPATSCGMLSRECPATFGGPAEGAACPTGIKFLDACDYDEGRCQCVGCSAVVPTTARGIWACRTWDSGGAGCPAAPPLAGSACSMPAQMCLYDARGFELRVGNDYECLAGRWQARQGPGMNEIHECPVVP